MSVPFFSVFNVKLVKVKHSMMVQHHKPLLCKMFDDGSPVFVVSLGSESQ